MTRAPVLVLSFAFLAACGSDGSAPPTVPVRLGAVVRTAVATGFVEPSREAQVNTQLGGFVRKVHAKLGQRVEAGAPLVEVWPTLTEQDLLRAERSLQAAAEGQEAAQEYVAGEHVLARVTRWMQGEKNLDRMQRSADRSLKNAEESLELLRNGAVEIDGRRIDFVVRAPMAGHVLQIAREGDPITPASTYGTGTVVAVVGDLEQPVFRGSVDEIDVGRLREGMVARVTLGALPERELRGEIVEIGLRARRQDNASLFDIRIALHPDADVALRAGYSAVASIELARAEGVPVLPERVVRYADGRPFVVVRGAGGAGEHRDVELGVSDGLVVEVRSGVAVGDAVLDGAGTTR